jgi:hypothetical protein
MAEYFDKKGFGQITQNLIRDNSSQFISVPDGLVERRMIDEARFCKESNARCKRYPCFNTNKFPADSWMDDKVRCCRSCRPWLIDLNAITV